MNHEKIAKMRAFLDEYFVPGSDGKHDEETEEFLKSFREMIDYAEGNEDRRRDVIVAGINNKWGLQDIKHAIHAMEQYGH